MSSRTHRSQPLFFLRCRQLIASNLSLSGSLGWAEGALKGHPRNSDSGAAIEFLSASSIFSVYLSVLVLFRRSSWLKNWACDGHDFFWGATAGVWCAMVCTRGRGWCPGRHLLRFAIYRLCCGHRQSLNSRRISSETLGLSSWTNSSNSIQSNSKESVLDLFVTWIESNSLAPQWKCLLGYSFFDRSEPNSIQPNSESRIGLTFFSLKRALRGLFWRENRKWSTRYRLLKKQWN